MDTWSCKSSGIAKFLANSNAWNPKRCVENLTQSMKNLHFLLVHGKGDHPNLQPIVAALNKFLHQDLFLQNWIDFIVFIITFGRFLVNVTNVNLTVTLRTRQKRRPKKMWKSQLVRLKKFSWLGARRRPREIVYFGLLRYRLYRPWICQASCRHSRLGGTQGNGSLVVEFEAVHTCFFESKKKKTSSFSGLHPHIPLLLYQWAWRTHVLQGKSPPEILILHLLSKLFWNCLKDTKRSVWNRLGTKKNTQNIVKRGAKYTF